MSEFATEAHSDQVFIGFNAKGEEVFGTSEELREYLNECEREEMKYGGDTVDYTDHAAEDTVERLNSQALRVQVDFNKGQEQEL